MPIWSVAGAAVLAPSIAGLDGSFRGATVRVGPPLSASTPPVPVTVEPSPAVKVMERVAAKTLAASNPASPATRLLARVSVPAL